MMPSRTIMIQFSTPKQKQTFYSLYLNNIPLNPAKFGLDELNRIIIGENLTRKNAEIFKRAQLFKKDKKIAQAFTENGLVKIKLKRGKQTPTHMVGNVIELETLVGLPQQSLASKHHTNVKHNQHSRESAHTTSIATNTTATRYQQRNNCTGTKHHQRNSKPTNTATTTTTTT